MSLLLKIVQGPNAGAEIALVEGTTISVGSGDSCDIILNDAALDAVAFEIEVTSERVMMLFPDGKQHRLEEYHVKTVGTTSFVMGPAEDVWQEIVWEKKTSEAKAEDEAEENSEEKAGEEKSAEPEKAEEEEKNAGEKKEGRGLAPLLWGVILILIILLLLSAVGTFWYFFPQQMSKLTGGTSQRVTARAKPYVQKAYSFVVMSADKVKEWTRSDEEKKAIAEAAIPCESLDDIARELNLTQTTNKNGVVKMVGDFKTRSERLKATGRLYRAKPGIKLDFTDAESLRNSIDGVLSILGDIKVKVAGIEGRKAFFEGSVGSMEELKMIAEAVERDVAKVKETDYSKVLIRIAKGFSVTKDVMAEAEKLRAEANRKTAEEKSEGTVPDTMSNAEKVLELSQRQQQMQSTEMQPDLPVIGILTVPYPCLVLQNGMRVMEGAKLGEYVVAKITSESVVLSGANGSFTWRP